MAVDGHVATFGRSNSKPQSCHSPRFPLPTAVRNDAHADPVTHPTWPRARLVLSDHCTAYHIGRLGGPMTSSERTDSQTTAVSAAEAAVGRHEYETAELGKDQVIEALKRELAEAREQQTATAEILRVISQSQRDVQPVFEAIAANARKLCGGTTAWVN